MKCVPLYNKIYVEILPEEEPKTKSGLLLSVTESPFMKAVVLDVGKGYYQNATRIPMDIHVGDIVLLPKNGSMLLVEDKPNQPKRYIVADNEVYCKVEE